MSNISMLVITIVVAGIIVAIKTYNKQTQLVKKNEELNTRKELLRDSKGRFTNKEEEKVQENWIIDPYITNRFSL